LSFEPELRCKHCGFDFSLAVADVSARSFDELEQQNPDVPMVDLQLRSVEMDERPAPALGVMRPRPDAAAGPRRVAASVALADPIVARAPRPARLTVPRQVPTPTTDLPLFMKGIVPPDTPALARHENPEGSEDASVQVPAAPRPLVVRRAPELARSAADAALAAPAHIAAVPRVAAAPPPLAGQGKANAPARLKAAGLDLAVLLALNVAVLLLTLRQCDLSIAQIASVPVLPLVTFQASLTLAYLLSFSVASGQTIGKMVFGLRVVADRSRGAGALATPRQMSYRVLLTIPSVLLFGLGFLPGLVGEGRAVHDRLTHTRVVRE